jgi:hypothetical protein
LAPIVGVSAEWLITGEVREVDPDQLERFVMASFELLREIKFESSREPF